MKDKSYEDIKVKKISRKEKRKKKKKVQSP